MGGKGTREAGHLHNAERESGRHDGGCCARASPRPWGRHGQRPARLGSAGCPPLGRSLPPQARAAASREPPDLRPVTRIEHLKWHLAHVGCSANVCRMMNKAAPDAAVKRMC